MLMSIDVYGRYNFLPDDILNLKAAALYYAVGDHCHAKATDLFCGIGPVSMYPCLLP
jgi:hypothetical protein